METRRARFQARTQSNTAVTRRHRPDYKIVLYMGLLMLLGLIVMYAIGPQRAQVLNNSYDTDYYTSTYFFIKQTVSVLIGFGAFIAMATIPYTFFQKHASKILLAGFGACLLLAFAALFNLGIAQASLGATRWFDLGPLGSLQPAEILKFGILIFFAGFLGARAQQGLINDVHKTLIPFGIVYGLAMFLIVVVQKDLGTGISLTSIAAAMLVVAGISRKIGAMIFAGLLVVGTISIITAPHRIERMVTFFKGDNTSVSDAEGYHITHAKIAIGTGGLTGVGSGKSVQATGYLPEAINDSVFAILGETFGFVGLMAILALFTALLLRLLKVIDYLVDMRLKLLVAGVFGWFGIHAILNIAAMIGIFPLTGITLPLLSFGGTSMVFIAAALGLAFQLSRYTSHSATNQKEIRHENPSSRRGVGRTRYASRRSPSRT